MSTVYPVVLAEWPRNSREIIRIALDKCQGHDVIDARAWWRDEQGKWKAGRSGLTLSLKHLPTLTDGSAAALKPARALGLVEGV